jgi:MFS family permease
LAYSNKGNCHLSVLFLPHNETDLQPTKFEKLRALPWSLSYDLSNTLFVQLTFFGSVFILFLNDLGLDKSQIGILLSVLPFLSLLSLFITAPVARLGYRKTFLLSLSARNLFTGGLLLVPWMTKLFSGNIIIYYVGFITLAFSLSRAVAMTAFLPWQQEYIPPEIRGRYSGYSSIIISLAGLVAVAIAGFLIAQPLGLGRYTLLFGVGVFFGILSIYIATRFPGGTPLVDQISLFQVNKNLFQPLRDSRFIRYLVALGLITLAVGPIFSFLPIFMKEKVGLSDSSIIFLQTGGLIGGLLSSYFWGWLADRYGSKPISLSSLLLTIALPIMWSFMPRGSSLSLPIALFISLIQGVAGSGWGIGSGRLLFVSIVSAELKTEYLSQYNAWIGLLSGVGSILGGVLLQYFSAFQGKIFNIGFDSYSVLFGIGFLLSLSGSMLLASLSVLRETSLGEFAGLFFHGNPLMAISSVIRFYYARGEVDALNATEKLGSARSPFTVQELIDSLNDPRFYVRLEAIISITRHSADDRLVQALVDVMEAPDPALSTIAAWALGRIGNEKALPALRDAFRISKYNSVQAQAARALGNLGDRESISQLREHIQTNPDLGFKVACASGLGNLGVIESIPDLLNVLYQTPYPPFRREVGLSLARLLGAENQYIRLSRLLTQDPGTILAQEMETLRGFLTKNFVPRMDISEHLIDAREQFAREELDAGFQSLLAAINWLISQDIQPHCQQILAECQLRMREFGRTRLEYPLLAIVVMEKAKSNRR